MCQIDYRPKGFQAVAVALANNEIHLYKDKFLVDVIQVEENIYSMKFGRLGREDATLVMITKSKNFFFILKNKKKSIYFILIDGGLIIKILKRTATFEESDTLHGPPKEQQVKIDVPKRTKLYVDQTLREKEQAESKRKEF
jgi:Bardet-Biedl syndrome 1 protein